MPPPFSTRVTIRANIASVGPTAIGAVGIETEVGDIVPLTRNRLKDAPVASTLNPVCDTIRQVNNTEYDVAGAGNEVTGRIEALAHGESRR
jgi:hypothetical protein